MDLFFDSIIEFIQSQNDAVLYFFIFISAIIENLFPPIPGDTITAFGAFLVGTGRLNYIAVFFCSTIGSTIGFFLLFLFGRYLGREFFMKKNYKNFSMESIEKAEQWFQKRGYLIILANRFMPGVRSVISITAGISELKPLPVFLLSLVSAAVWNTIWIHAGFTLGGSWDSVKSKITSLISTYNTAAGILLSAAVIIFIVKKIITHRKKRK